MNNNYCIDCNKLLVNPRAKRCVLCCKKGKLNGMFGKHVSDDFKNKMSLLKKGVPISKKHKINISDGLREAYRKGIIKPWNKGLDKNCFSKKTLELLKKRGKESAKKNWSSSEYLLKQSKSMKNVWLDPIKRSNIIKGLKVKQNKPEKLLESLLNELFFNEYKFVGDFKFFIERYNPDFINCNGQKKIIELYGDYWHNLKENKNKDVRRLKTYKKYGYKTLIVWESELRRLDVLKERLADFNKVTAEEL